MKLRNANKSRRREPDLTSLINVVFLILIFFIVAGTLRPFSARDIKLAKSHPDNTGVAKSAMLIAHADGRLSYRGEAISLEQVGTRLGRDRGDPRTAPLTIVADARLSAKRLLEITRALRGTGNNGVAILIERHGDK